jgi:dolichyl-phosphate-mannose-protein mannosyltransferase
MADVQQRKGPPTGSVRSSRSPVPKEKSSAAPAARRKDYRSEGVEDNDIFLLPGSDFQLLGVLTVVAAAVRLFRIYQPSSVVFDEVQ